MRVKTTRRQWGSLSLGWCFAVLFLSHRIIPTTTGNIQYLVFSVYLFSTKVLKASRYFAIVCFRDGLVWPSVVVFWERWDETILAGREIDICHLCICLCVFILYLCLHCVFVWRQNSFSSSVWDIWDRPITVRDRLITCRDCWTQTSNTNLGINFNNNKA